MQGLARRCKRRGAPIAPLARDENKTPLLVEFRGERTLTTLRMGARRAVVLTLAVAALIVGLEVRSVFRHEPRDAHEAALADAPAATRDVPAAANARNDLAPASPKPMNPNAWRAHFSWSSDPSSQGTLGRLARSEGNAEGPASLAVNAAGTALLIDGVNHRLVFATDTGPSHVAASPVALAFDVTPLANGSFALLDRLVDKVVVVVDSQGHVLVRAPLGIQAGEAGLLTGVFSNRDDVCVEREHGACVPVVSPDGGAPDDARELPGRPASDGVSLLHAGIVGARSSRVHLTRSEAHPFRHGFTKEFLFPANVGALAFLDANSAGELYLGVMLESSPDEVVVLCLATETGIERGRTVVPTSPLADEVTREFAVVPNGGFLHLHRTVDGANVRRYPCEP